MPTNFPSGPQSRGVPVEGFGGIGSPLLTMGNVYHVDSGADTADNDNAGTNPKQPLATLDGAIGNARPAMATSSWLPLVTARQSVPPLPSPSM